MTASVLTIDDFAPEGRRLRAVFDRRFAEPRQARAERFVWDWWHVPGQYTALRTPAWTYFPAPLYRAFHTRLVRWGREVLGCHDVSPPWLSCYVEGCRQELHGDLPHGPWAFVYSLTPWAGRVFRGGETLLVRDEVLDFWRDFRSVRSIEEPDILRAVAPRFGRLTVFDPRVPHGVREVRGTHDPRLGRLVIHGWFVQPRPFIDGPVPARELQAVLDDLGGEVARWLGGAAPAGVLSARLEVAASGEVRAARILSNTLRDGGGDRGLPRRLASQLRRAALGWRFGRQRRGSRITIPLVFEREA